MTRPLNPNDAELQATQDDALALYSQSIRDFTMGLYAQSLRLAEERVRAESAVKKEHTPGEVKDAGQ